ncbi:nitrous oxide reductase accessory protein NosL [Inhella inkyongensis]|uniref:Nitrous oxide reductase accessory protein NosL n=1 Tax=Inhella inkyongensis TaxID=392593 RepID=A0A840S4E6_9BURK|nr:nitrous oxide reductase accessory protein NosL [Inhella inkyongensis]MBB5203379.1 nitrous oxide reductase accessory protein NosL [Inhella inkyongensis]
MTQSRRTVLRLGLGALAASACAGTVLALRRRPAPDLPSDLCITAPAWPYDPQAGLPAQAPRRVPAEARCPVCGMFPARQPRWAAQLRYLDDSAQFFDSPLTLALWWQAPTRYSPGRQQTDVAALWVQDFASGRWLDATQAHYVHGSRERGPMRNGNLPPFGDSATAQVFAKANGGRVLSWRELDAELLRALDTRIHDHA